MIVLNVPTALTGLPAQSGRKQWGVTKVEVAALGAAMAKRRRLRVDFLNRVVLRKRQSFWIVRVILRVRPFYYRPVAFE